MWMKLDAYKDKTIRINIVLKTKKKINIYVI